MTDAAPESPRADETEVSVFGPGLGEAIAIHLGAGDWITIDSCLDDRGRPAALAYLERIGVDPSAIRRIVATHWDDDHTGGLAALLSAATEADFACSGALRTREFLTLAEAAGRRTLMETSGVDEFARVIEVLRGRKARGERFPSPTFVQAGLPVWERAAPPARVTALAPSDATLVLAQLGIAAMLPDAGESKRRIQPPTPNAASVVLAVDVGELHILLGGDLECAADHTRGWTAILDGDHRPASRASAFKVPHHGSSDAHDPRVWDELLEPGPVSVLTPFRRGSVELPRTEDCARIIGLSPRAFITSGRAPRKRDRLKAVERTLRETGISVRDAEPPMGHVRLRKAPEDQDWRIECFDPACPLNEL